MSEEKPPENSPMITVPSTRFGDLEVPADSVIELPAGLIGFPTANKFILVESHLDKPTFQNVSVLKVLVQKKYLFSIIAAK